MEPPTVCTGLRKLKIAPYEKMNAFCKSAIGMFNKVRERIRTFTLRAAKRKEMKACYLVIPLARYNKEEMCGCIKVTCDLAQGLLEMRWYIE